MSLNDTALGLRTHIGFFGVRNAGKSSLVNAFTGQDLAVVSPVEGTTTDPVEKTMELLPVGPVVIIDTPGIDDEGELGERRVRKAREVLRRADVAVHVVDAARGLTPADNELEELFAQMGVPRVLVWNKADLLAGEGEGASAVPEGTAAAAPAAPGEPGEPVNELCASAATGWHIHELKELVAAVAHQGRKQAARALVSDLIDPGDVVVLVIPIDESAPAGRVILPQQMVLRDVLDSHASALCCQPEELGDLLAHLPKPPRLVITDSQAFGQVSRIVPQGVVLTSFSILMARFKGDLPVLTLGAAALSRLTDESRVLISEGCTHHRQCMDIGTVKMPAWIRSFSGAHPAFEFTSGREFPLDVSSYDVVVHCGGCMLNAKEMASRIDQCRRSGVPMVNYGVAIAHMHGILRRSLEPFPLVARLLDEAAL